MNIALIKHITKRLEEIDTVATINENKKHKIGSKYDSQSLNEPTHRKYRGKRWPKYIKKRKHKDKIGWDELSRNICFSVGEEDDSKGKIKVGKGQGRLSIGADNTNHKSNNKEDIGNLNTNKVNKLHENMVRVYPDTRDTKTITSTQSLMDQSIETSSIFNEC